MSEFIEVIPPMKRVHEDWYLGTADAVYQNLESVEVENPRQVLILSGDHIYKMNYLEMVEWHNATTRMSLSPRCRSRQPKRFASASQRSTRDYSIRGFEEKPQHGNPVRSVFNPDMVSASMGIYIFERKVLTDALIEDAADPDSAHDFGKDVLPRLYRPPSRYRIRFSGLERENGAVLARCGNPGRVL